MSVELRSPYRGADRHKRTFLEGAMLKSLCSFMVGRMLAVSSVLAQQGSSAALNAV